MTSRISPPGDEAVQRVAEARLPRRRHLAGTKSSEERERLRTALEGFLSRAQGRAVGVTEWRSEPSAFAVPSVSPIDVLTVSLRGGEEVALFVKQVGSEQADHPDKQCRDREEKIYEELFSGRDLPVPRYYGARWNTATGRREIYLEYIADWSLKYQGLETWFPAARRLARLHAHFSERGAAEVSRCGVLLNLDTAYFHAWAQRAMEVLAEVSAPLAGRLAVVVSEYDRVAEALAAQPVTLVHNDLAPKNVLADRSRDPARIAFVDWEMAGAGCGLLDLVHLKDGLRPASDEAMRRAYCSELGGSGLLPRSEPELRHVLTACELHLILHRIASSRLWHPPLEHLTRWVAEARDRASRLGARGKSL